MLYYPGGSQQPSLRDTVAVQIDMRKPCDHEEGYLSRFALHQQICAVIVDAVSSTNDIDKHVDCCVRVRISLHLNHVRVDGRARDIHRALETMLKLDLTFDPEDNGDGTGALTPPSAKDRLLRVVENQVTLAWPTYRLDQFTADATVLIDSLRVLMHRESHSVHDFLRALRSLEAIDVLYGWNHDGYWNFGRRWQGAMPEGWPEGLPDSPNVLMVDNAGQTLIVNELGRLAIGASVAERMAEQGIVMASALPEIPSGLPITASR